MPPMLRKRLLLPAHALELIHLPVGCRVQFLCRHARLIRLITVAETSLAEKRLLLPLQLPLDFRDRRHDVPDLLLDDDDEFIPAEAGAKPFVLEDLLQHTGKADENLIALSVAVFIVDFLEMVEIDQQYAEGTTDLDQVIDIDFITLPVIELRQEILLRRRRFKKRIGDENPDHDCRP